jgi:flagellar secretion chaperone FliS
MRHHGYQNYFDNEVLAASPSKLIQLLYEAALASIATARRSLRRGEIPPRVRAINKTIRILTELSGCLNHKMGGDISRRLGVLYSYVVRLLIEANSKQSEDPLAEAERLLATITEAWKTLEPTPQALDLPSPDIFMPDVHGQSRASAP